MWIGKKRKLRIKKRANEKTERIAQEHALDWEKKEKRKKRANEKTERIAQEHAISEFCEVVCVQQ